MNQFFAKVVKFCQNLVTLALFADIGERTRASSNADCSSDSAFPFKFV